MKQYSRLFSGFFSIAALLLLGVAQAFPAESDPPSRVARLTQIAGQVALEPAGTNQWTQAAGNTPLTTGDRIYVDLNGHAELQMGQIAVRVWRYTDLTLANLSNAATQLALTQGSLHVRTFSLSSDISVEVDTPNGAITVVEPGDVRLDVYMGDGGTLVTVDSGEVQLRGPKLSKILGAGQSARLLGSALVTFLPQRMPGKDPFDLWSQQLDRKLLSSGTLQYVNPNTIGLDDLDQNGTWNRTPDDGAVWYPTGVATHWSPYANGHWTWIFPWGWTWVDADTWGFAPFHYGRWIRTGSRWGWVPGPREVAPVYSPAMVAFVGGAHFYGKGGDPLAGWFPLGPGEPFYPSYISSARYFTEINMTNLRGAGPARRKLNASNYASYYHTHLGFRSIRYVHRRLGTIAVPLQQLAAGQEITPDLAMHPSAQQLLNTRILTHPRVAPTLQSLAPHPVASIPVPAERPEMVLLSQPTEAALAAPATPGESPGTPPNPRLRVIAGTSPPATSAGFEQQLPALNLEPGRPLDAAQMHNLAQGRLAGPADPADFPPDRSFSPGAALHRNRKR
jgi:Family of unknown function (DUF6600)